MGRLFLAIKVPHRENYFHDKGYVVNGLKVYIRYHQRDDGVIVDMLNVLLFHSATNGFSLR